MIRYQLRCGQGHVFEGWFRNSAAFADDVGGLACPICDDRRIEKAIMAPAVRQQAARPEPAVPPAPAAQPENTLPAAAPPTASVAALPDPEQRRLAGTLALMRALKAHVEANFENVGRRFAEEARRMHHEEVEPRGIYGEASIEEVESLEKEGIAVAPLPDLPKLDS